MPMRSTAAERRNRASLIFDGPRASLTVDVSFKFDRRYVSVSWRCARCQAWHEATLRVRAVERCPAASEHPVAWQLVRTPGAFMMRRTTIRRYAEQA